MKSPLARLTLLVAAAAVSVSAPDTLAGVVDSRYDLQYYLDFCRNKGMFATGATNIEVFFKDGTSVTNNVIPLMPNMDSYGQVVQAITGNTIVTSGGTNLVSAQFVYGAKHVHDTVGNTDVAFLAENENAGCVYNSANLDTFGTDSSMQRLTKLVTSVVYTPMADDAFMSSLTLNGSWLYRTGNGGTWCDGNSIYTGRNSLGGVVNLSVCWQNSDTGEWYLEGWARKTDNSNDWATPLDIGVYSGDSGSPYFAWDEEHNRFVFVGALWAGGAQRSLPNWYLPRYNYRQGTAVIDKYTVIADKFSGTEKITWGVQDNTLGTGTLTQGENSVSYTGKGSGNTIADTLGITFSTTDSENEQTLELAGSVNMGAGALTFESGKWKLSEADSSYTLASAGFEIKKGAELTLDLTGTTSEEIRKVGEGTLTIAGSGNNESKLVVGGGTTVYNVTKDADGNITDCTLGNAGETRLNRDGGYAASSVRLEGGVAIVVLMQDGQFKTNSTAGDTFSFGNDGGLLNLNGHNLEWGVINQNGSGTGARIGNFTPLNETTPGNATFTYTGAGAFAGSFMDEGANGAQLAVVYNNATEGSTWTLTGNSSNAGGFTVEAGTMKLEGAKTPHVNFSDANDWHYASIETSKVSVQSGATFQLSHHALLSGNVEVEAGGNFVLNQTVNAASESVSGSLRQDMAKLGITSLIGNVSLSGNATMTVNTTSPVATTIQGNISGDTSSSTFTKTGSGLFIVNGQVSVGTGTVEAGGIVVKDKENFTGTWTIRDAGYLGVEGMNGDAMLSHVSADSTGVLALGADQTTAIADPGNYTNLYIGALDTLTKAVEYGAAGTTDTLSANSENKWLLGGGGGTLNVNFKLTGENDLIVGNDHSGGTVHLTNTNNDFSGDIIIKGTGNILTYVNGALGSARVALAYGNTLGLNSAEQLSILKDGAQGVLALTRSQDLDLSGRETAIGAVGDLTYTGTLTVGDTYRFGGSGNLTLDTDLSKASSMKLDGQGNSGSSVTFARENAFTGDIVAGGGLLLSNPNSTGNIGIHAGHAETFASVNSMTMQKGAILDTDGRESIVIRNLSAESGSTIKNSGNTATLLQLNVAEGVSTTVADGVLLSANNSASIALVKTGAGTLTMGANSTWSGGLTVMEGTVKAFSGGVGASNAAIYVKEGATLHLTMNKCTGYELTGGNITQKIIGTGTVRLSSGGSVLFSASSNVAFEGSVELVDNTRLWVGSMKNSPNTTYDNLTELSRATIVVNAGSQARVTNALRYGSGSPVSTTADFVITGTGYTGAYSTSNGTSTGGILQDSLMTGALGIDNGSTVYGNITLADNATIASESKNATNEAAWIFGYSNYGIINKLGGTIRGKILGEGKTLTFGGNEGMTITADSANTFGDLIIANGNGNNDDKFALRLDGGATKSQTSTALGTGTVTLSENLILRLAGTGTADSGHIAYTYENAISAGNGATLQSYNITNRLAGAVTMSGDTLNLSTANGGVLELAGGISGNGTLNVGANSKIVLGSASSAMTLARSGSAQFSGNVVTAAGADITLMSPAVVSTTTTFSGTDSLTLRLAGTEDYTLGGITVTDSDTADASGSSLTLNFDFSNTPDASDDSTYSTLSSNISAGNTVVSLSLNMFNDIESGNYTLATGTLSGEFSLEDTLNNRLSLTQNNGSLVLNVGADNRLYWAADGTNQEWNTTDTNWYQESSGKNVAFVSGSNVVLNSTGAANSTADSRETITLSADQTVGTLAAKDENAFYEVTGTATLSGTNLAVGLNGNLKLSTTTAAFTDGIRIDNATLEVSKTALTADVNATNGGSFSLNDNASLTGTLSISGGTMSLDNSTVTGNIDLKETSAVASINASSVTGNITLQGEGSATLNSLTLKGEIATETGGRIMAASAYNGTTATHANATLSGSLSWGGETGSSLSLTSGSLYLDGAVNLSELSVASGLTVTVWNNTATAGLEKMLSTVKLGNNATLRTYDVAAVEAATTIGALQMDGATATLHDQNHSGMYAVNTLKLGDGVSSSTLTLRKNAASSYSSVFNLGDATSEAGNFAGTIVLDEANSGGKRSAFIVLGNADIAKNAVISFADAKSGDAHIGLGVNVNNATIAGLQSETGDASQVKIFSGTIGGKQEWHTGSTSLPSTVGDAVRTLTINTAADTTHNFYGEILGNLNLVKSGAGTQKLLGTSNNFNGSISVQAGTLSLGGDASFGALSGLTVADGATLDLSDIDFSERTALSLAAGASSSVSSGAVFAFGALKSDTQYNIFDLSSGASLDGWNSNNLGVANFSINGESMLDMGRVYVTLGETTGSFTYHKETYNLVWAGTETDTWTRSQDSSAWKQSIGDSVSETTTYFANYDNVAFSTGANVTIAEAVKVGAMTIANGISVSLTETGALTAESISVGNGATLTFATEKAGYSAANISGEGKIVLALTDNWNNALKAGTDFSGETYVTSGYLDLTGATAGKTLRLANGVNANSFTGVASVSTNIILEGTTIVHANRDKPITYAGTITGTNGVFESNGLASHTFNAEVNLAGFKTAHNNTNTFNAKTAIGTATITQATVNFNGETHITAANISGGTVSFYGDTTINALNASAGTVNASGQLTKIGTGALAISNATALLSYVNVQEGSIEFTNGENTSKSVGTLTLGNSVVFSTQQNVSPGAATVVNTLNLSGGESTVRIGNAEAGTDSKWGNSHQGYLQFKELGVSGVESGTLNLVSNHNSGLRTIFELGDSADTSTSAGTFKGEINLAVNNSGNRSASLVLSDAAIAKNAHINLATNKGSSGVLSLGVNADHVTIAGLSSTLGTANAKVYSGKIGVASQTNAGYADSTGGNGTSRTLEINVAEGASYSYNGEILANLGLIKTGAGTQTLAGASSSFNGGISVEAGTLIAGHANALGTGAISVANGAVLQANAAIELSSASQTLTLVVGEEQVVPAAATYAALRSADPTGTALITAGKSTNGKISVSGDAVVYVDVSALTGTQSTLSGDTISLQLATASALDFNDENARVGWWDKSGTSWTDWSVANGYTYDTSSGLLTITIPEPSTFGLLAGLSALALCVSRRKCRK